ncbi:hypothetical protein [Microbacterium candidum]|uniref:DUF3040 domain-containing protein n=1 Tax=Microbacterium candidum TaxID=3041922 RepID=A0ABT7MWP1_9MICO|nr:hypothetical protein [Microbacterium sp. ASV49]MDL9978856.1 hypothetical protein [Microbacterium sp. ASV49]
MPDEDTDHDRLVRMEGKIDTLIFGRNDHEERIRALEARRTISPAQLWGAACALVGVLVGLSVLSRFVLEVIVR